MKHFRPGTWDATIARTVIQVNEYNVSSFSNLNTVLDIGCHIGSFCWLAASRGASRVIGFDPSPENCALARKNLSQFKCAEIRNLAVWRSDLPSQTLYFKPGNNPPNTGGGGVFNSEGNPVKTISLDEIIKETGEIDLIKMDCEGSEFPILLTCTQLHKVRRIVGEYHEFVDGIPVDFEIAGYNSFDMQVLKQFLEKSGFVVTSNHVFENLGKFDASRLMVIFEL